MKTRLLLTLFAAGLMLNLSAQTVFQSDLESWAGTPLNPTDWMGSKTNLAVDSVVQNATNPYHGTFCAKLISRSTSAKRFTTQPVAITAGKAYMISYSARGKGSIRAGLYSGKVTNSGAGYLYSNYETVSATTWHRFKQSVIADTTNGTTAQFILAVKSTVAANNDIDVDSVTIQQYTLPSGVTLKDIEYTTAANGNSPYYGMAIANFGGIVTANYSTGYYLQTSGTSSWSAVLVYDPANASTVAIGDSIKLTANVDEYFNMTEITNVTSFQKVSSGNTVPAPAIVSTTTPNAEMYEGILVQVTGNYVASTWSSSFHTWNVDDGGGAVVVDKQIYDAFPSAAPAAGMYMVTGPVNYAFSAFSIEPRTAADVVFLSRIEEYSNTLNAVIYPNPVSNELNVKLPFSASHASVTVADMLGNEVVKVNATGDMLSLKDINLAAGVYTLKVVADGKVQLSKIVKQ